MGTGVRSAMGVGTGNQWECMGIMGCVREKGEVQELDLLRASGSPSGESPDISSWVESGSEHRPAPELILEWEILT